MSRRSCSRPFLPTVRIFTVLPSARSFAAWARASRTIEELKPPQRPRSAVATTRRWVSSLPVPPRSFGADGLLPTPAARLPRTASMRSA